MEFFGEYLRMFPLIIVREHSNIQILYSIIYCTRDYLM